VCSNWLLAALLLALPSGRHWVVIHPTIDVVHYAYHEPMVFATDLLLGAVVASWLLSWLLSPGRTRLKWGPAFLFVPLLAFIALGLVGVPQAVAPRYGAFPVVRLVMLLTFYLMLLNAPLPREFIAWPLAASMAMQAIVSVPQFLLGHTVGLQQLGEISMDSQRPGASVVAIGEQRWLRAYGLTHHPNLLGGLAMVCLQIVTGFYLTQSGLRRLVLLGFLVVTYGALLLTFSRAAWLGAVVGGCALLGMIFLARRQGAQKVRASSLMLLAVVLLATTLVFVQLNWPLLRPRLGLSSEGIEIRSVEERAMLRDAALVLIRMRPLFGVGLGTFSSALYRLAPEAISYYSSFTPVHNVLLLATAELGILGGALWLCLIMSPWLALFLRRRQVRMTAWWAGLCGAMAALTVVSFLDHYVWSFQQGRLIFWLVWGLWAREWVRSPYSDGAGSRQLAVAAPLP
jgi:O-antigen ligase